MANQHRITALGVERAIGFVREGVAPQRCAALQRQGFGEVLRLRRRDPCWCSRQNQTPIKNPAMLKNMAGCSSVSVRL